MGDGQTNFLGGRTGMTSRRTVARLSAHRDNVTSMREVVDPRLEPFLRELARLLWLDVKRQLQIPGKDPRQ